MKRLVQSEEVEKVGERIRTIIYHQEGWVAGVFFLFTSTGGILPQNQPALEHPECRHSRSNVRACE